jgi:hypothetical protein
MDQYWLQRLQEAHRLREYIERHERLVEQARVVDDVEAIKRAGQAARLELENLKPFESEAQRAIASARLHIQIAQPAFEAAVEAARVLDLINSVPTLPEPTWMVEYPRPQSLRAVVREVVREELDGGDDDEQRPFIGFQIDPD